MPVSLLIKPTSGMCNMNCKYCFYCDEMQKRTTGNHGFMSIETLENVIRRTMLHETHTMSVAFQGGEPTLRGLEFYRECIALEKQYNRNGIRVHHALQTNGLLLDEDWCRFFREYHFLNGVSLDGTQEVHDAFRRDQAGGGTFRRVYSAIRMLERYGVDYNVLTVVTRKAAEHIEDIYRWYRKKGIRYQQYIVCLEPLGEGHGGEAYALTPDEYGTFLIRLFRLWYQDYKKGNKIYIRQFENYLGILLGYHPEACEQRGICGIQNVVEADGSVYPCDFYMLDEYRLGNFNVDGLKEIDRKRQEIGFVERSQNLEQRCRDCNYYYLCRGGCQRHRDLIGDTGAYHNYYCEGYRMFFDACIEQMQELIKEGV